MRKIIVDCERNDPVDIRCGGPQYLGFDFFVPDEVVGEMKEFILEELHKNKKPCISIVAVEEMNPNVKVWTKDMISKCIKDYEL